MTQQEHDFEMDRIAL